MMKDPIIRLAISPIAVASRRRVWLSEIHYLPFPSDHLSFNLFPPFFFFGFLFFSPLRLLKCKSESSQSLRGVLLWTSYRRASPLLFSFSRRDFLQASLVPPFFSIFGDPSLRDNDPSYALCASPSLGLWHSPPKSPSLGVEYDPVRTAFPRFWNYSSVQSHCPGPSILSISILNVTIASPCKIFVSLLFSVFRLPSLVLGVSPFVLRTSDSYYLPSFPWSPNSHPPSFAPPCVSSSGSPVSTLRVPCVSTLDTPLLFPPFSC